MRKRPLEASSPGVPLSGIVVMALSRELLHPALIAVAAVWGSLLVVPERAVASPASRARAVQMLQNGCCCVTRTAGCCCESPTPIRLAPSPNPVGAALWAERLESDFPRNTCQCRSGNPVAPSRAPEPRSSEGRGASEPGSSVEWLRRDPADTRVAHVPSPATSPPRCPLYLRLSHLVI